MNTEEDMSSNDIDALLERYLHLLHDYTTLRKELSTLQTGMYQNIARANFSAERGMRYGADFYDDRMQASRGLQPLGMEDGQTNWKVVMTDDHPTEASNLGVETAAIGVQDDTRNGSQAAEVKSSTAKKHTKKDPLQWFGLLVPQPLRQAQAQSIRAVEEVIPRLIAVDAKMQQVEIDVRRARKKQAKFEAAAAKHQSGGLASQELTA